MSTPSLPSKSIDNRREPRYAVAWPARLELGPGRTLDVKVRDISESGLGLRCEQPLPERAKLQIVVGVPDLHDPTRLQAVPGLVCLVFVVMSGHEWRLGAQWLEIGEPARLLLKQWITKLRFG